MVQTCEFIGIHELSIIIDKKGIGLYRHDGLIILRNCNRQKTDKTKKIIINILKSKEL